MNRAKLRVWGDQGKSCLGSEASPTAGSGPARPPCPKNRL